MNGKHVNFFVSLDSLFRRIGEQPVSLKMLDKKPLEKAPVSDIECEKEVGGTVALYPFGQIMLTKNDKEVFFDVFGMQVNANIEPNDSIVAYSVNESLGTVFYDVKILN